MPSPSPLQTARDFLAGHDSILSEISTVEARLQSLPREVDKAVNHAAENPEDPRAVEAVTCLRTQLAISKRRLAILRERGANGDAAARSLVESLWGLIVARREREHRDMLAKAVAAVRPFCGPGYNIEGVAAALPAVMEARALADRGIPTNTAAGVTALREVAAEAEGLGL